MVGETIALQAGQNIPAFGPDWNALANQQRTAVYVQQAQQQVQAENALRALYSDPQNYDPQTQQPTPDAWNKLYAASPRAAMELQKNALAMQQQRTRMQFERGQIAKQYRDEATDIATKSLAAYEDASKTMTPDAALRVGQQTYTDLVNPWKANLPPEVAAQVSPTFDPTRARQTTMTAARAKNIEDNWETREDYGHLTESGKPTEYSYNKITGQSMDLTRRAPYMPSGVGKPVQGTEPDLWTVMSGGKRVAAIRDPQGGFLDEKTRKPIVDATDPRKPGTEKETGEYGKVSQIAIDDPDSPGDTKIVPAQQNTKSGQWVTADANRDPLPTPKRIVSTGGAGRQAEAQTMAMINAGNEATGSLRNLVELPVGATSGWFKGLTSQPADSIASNIGRSLAGEVNDRDARSLQISWQGIGRSLATLEAAGRATGLVGLQKQAEALQPQKGDTYTNVLRSYAEIRQIVERSVETIKNSPGVSADQKRLLNKIVDEAKTTVPWTVHDVNQLETGGKESVLEFAKKVKVGAQRTEDQPTTPQSVTSGGGMPTLRAGHEQEDFDAIPSGQKTWFTTPDGRRGYKP